MADNQGAEDKLPEGAKRVPSKAKSNKGIFVVIGIVLFLLALPGLLLMGFVSWISQGDHAIKLTESIIEKSLNAEGVDIDVKNAKLTVESEDGDTVSYDGSSGQERPKNFPSEVAMYKTQEIVSSISGTEGEIAGWNISANTDDSYKQVADFLESEYEKGGWELTGSTASQSVTSFSFKKDTLSVNILITGQEDSRYINYVVSQDSNQ